MARSVACLITHVPLLELLKHVAIVRVSYKGDVIAIGSLE